MKLSRRILAVLCIVLTLTLLMTACGSSSKEQPDTKSKEDSVQKDDKPAEVEKTQEQAPKKEANITVTYMQSGTYDNAAKDVAEQLKSEGINVKVEAFPWAVLRQKNTTDIVAGSFNYDVMSGSYYLVDIYPHFTPLKTYMDTSNYADGLIPGILDKCEKFNGETVGAPYGVDCYGIIYRTDIFEQAGIQPPKTWDEFNKNLEILKQKLPKDIHPYAFAAGANEQLLGLFTPRYSGYYISKDGKYQIESDKAVQVVKDIANTFKYGPSNINALSIDQANALFLQGKVAIIEGWPSFIIGQAIDTEKSQVVGKWGVAAYPKGGFSWLSLWNLFIPKESKNPEAAWKWIETYTSEKNATAQFVKYGIGSCYTSSYSNQDVVDKYGASYLQGQVENIKIAKNPPLSGEAQDVFNKTLGDVFIGKISAEEAIKRINEKWASLTVPESTLQSAQNDGLQEK